MIFLSWAIYILKEEQLNQGNVKSIQFEYLGTTSIVIHSPWMLWDVARITRNNSELYDNLAPNSSEDLGELLAIVG